HKAEGRSLEVVAASMLQAELLHLNDQDDESDQLFETTIVPALTGLGKEVALIASFNRAEINFARLRPSGYYSLVEQARMMGFTLSDSESILSAETAAINGKHFEALPAFWREVVRTFRQTSWTATRWATTRLARECLQISMPHEAA